MKDIDNERTVKENIKIIEHKLWNTKKVINGKYNMRIYRKCPKNIIFKNDMINDMNQNLCGGWFINWSSANAIEQNNLILARVLNYQKPMCALTTFKSHTKSLKNIIEYENKIGRIWFDTEMINLDEERVERLVARKGLMKYLFDLETLKKDYENNGIEIDIEPVKNKSLKDYFFDWDAQDDYSEIETWETGLILGYPIENTISLYKE